MTKEDNVCQVVNTVPDTKTSWGTSSFVALSSLKHTGVSQLAPVATLPRLQRKGCPCPFHTHLWGCLWCPSGWFRARKFNEFFPLKSQGGKASWPFRTQIQCWETEQPLSSGEGGAWVDPQWPRDRPTITSSWSHVFRGIQKRAPRSCVSTRARWEFASRVWFPGDFSITLWKPSSPGCWSYSQTLEGYLGHLKVFFRR